MTDRNYNIVCIFVTNCQLVGFKKFALETQFKLKFKWKEKVVQYSKMFNDDYYKLPAEYDHERIWRWSAFGYATCNSILAPSVTNICHPKNCSLNQGEQLAKFPTNRKKEWQKTCQWLLFLGQKYCTCLLYTSDAADE